MEKNRKSFKLSRQKKLKIMIKSVNYRKVDAPKKLGFSIGDNKIQIE
jgi:hypothetical protein